MPGKAAFWVGSTNCAQLVEDWVDDHQSSATKNQILPSAQKYRGSYGTTVEISANVLEPVRTQAKEEVHGTAYW